MEMPRESSLSIVKRFNRSIVLGAVFSVLGAQNIQVFSPEPGQHLPVTEVLIAASFYGLVEIDTQAVQLVIDGRDLSRLAFIDADMLTYSPGYLPPGTHQVTITVGRLDGGSPYVQSWSFKVLGVVEEEVLQWSGKVTSRVRYDKFDEEELGVGQVGLDIRGRAYDWIGFKGNLKLTTEEDPLIQPRNRFSFGLALGPYLDLNMGDTYPRLSPFLIDGKRVRGIEANLKLGVFNFRYLRGAINRAIQGPLNETYQVKRMAQEGDQNIVTLSRKGYTFRRELQAARLGLGRGDRFKFGLNLLKVRDDRNSVRSNLPDAQVLVENEILAPAGLPAGEYTLAELLEYNSRNNFLVSLEERSDWNGVSPQDNIVFGTDLGIYLDRKRILLEGELALSLLNRDIWEGAISKQDLDTFFAGDTLEDNSIAGSVSLDDIPIDPIDWENWFILNGNIAPLMPIDISAFSDTTEVTIGQALLGMPSLALGGRARFNYFGHYLTLKFTQVGPEFNTLANPFLLTGNRELELSDKIQLFKNRLLVTLIYKHQDDDILTAISNKTAQNTFTTNLTIIPGPDLPTLNLSFRSMGRDNGIKSLDTLFNATTRQTSYSDNRENTRTANLTASLNYGFEARGWKHNLTGTLVNLAKDDLFRDRDLDSNFVDPGVASNVVNLTLNTRFGSALKTTLMLTTNRSEFSVGPQLLPNSQAQQTFTSLGLDGEYAAFNDRATLLGGVTFLSARGQTELTRWGLKGGVKGSLKEALTLNLLTDFRVNSSAQGTTNNLVTTANLIYTF